MIVECLNVNDALQRVTVKVYPLTGAIDLSSKTPIPINPTVDEYFVIDWQTDLVPDDVLDRTYAQRFGNVIALITNRYNTPIGYATSTPEFYQVFDGELIETVTFPANVLNTGFLNIL